MADSIERIIDAMEHDACDIRHGRQWMAACEHYATRLRALSPAGGDWVMVLADVLERDGGKACNCINHSRKAEREYEAGQCPHQRAAAMLAASPQQEPGPAINSSETYSKPIADPSGQTLAGAGEGVSLPELPEPAGHSGIPAFSEFYTADQMREYARRALEAG